MNVRQNNAASSIEIQNDEISTSSDNNELISDENDVDIVYSVLDIPPIGKTIILSIQQFLTMACAMLCIPYIICSTICIADDDPSRAYVFSTMFFVSAITTTVQSFVGVRLPVFQGMSASFLIPIFNIMALPQFKCPLTNVTNIDQNQIEDPQIWQFRMRELQGSIALASLLQIFLSVSGALNTILRFITPLVVIPTITIIGISIMSTAIGFAEGNWAVALCTTLMLIICSQHLENVFVPYVTFNRQKKFGIKWITWFKFFPIVTTIVCMWIICLILTLTDVLPKGNLARTDIASLSIRKALWFKFPYPGQWGVPTTSVPSFIGMLTASFAVIIESIGDYFACARITGVPPPPNHAINRGILIEGFGCLIAGLFGTGCGTTTYADCIGAMSITKVGCRRIIYIAVTIMLLFGVMTKFTAVFVSIPTPIIGGLLMVTCSLITGVGLSTAQYINLNSSRNIFILGFCIWFGLSMPSWISNNKDYIQTGNHILNEALVVLLSTSMFIAGFCGFLLDNTIPGNRADRGLDKWMVNDGMKLNNKRATLDLYNLPFGMNFINQKTIFRYIPFCPPFLKRSDLSSTPNVSGAN